MAICNPLSVHAPPHSIGQTLLPNAPAAAAGALRFVCVPCQHFSGRGLHDRFKSLWCSWAVVGVCTVCMSVWNV